MPSRKESDEPRLLRSTDPLWSVTDIIGLFVDAVARGEPPDSEILGYYRDTVSNLVYALIRDRTTGRTLHYEIDTESKTPRPIRALRPVR